METNNKKITRIAGAFIRNDVKPQLTNEALNETQKEMEYQPPKTGTFQASGMELYNFLRNEHGLKKDWLRIALENAPIKMKQNEIAKKMGVHESLISYVLDGKRVHFGIRLERFIKKLYEVEKI